MKRLIIINTMIIAATCLLVSCRNQNDSHNTNTCIKSKNNHMVRTVTSSGLEYETLHVGSGESPSIGKMVTVHYTGWLNNNGVPSTKFDSSVDRGKPFSFTIGVGQVIKGWDEGVMTMKVGEKRRLFIPSNLGYGSRGAGSVIPANANLIFDVELISIT
ncbi:MAG TPA: FKBP-type peptidyl-prolyl cis-trans isomerase [Candidatus Babeliales bacterium]|nr:FKBP-type peptidyl-prolyl cis-trans isomerase [Candidatus Babeliales bacterium]